MKTQMLFLARNRFQRHNSMPTMTSSKLPNGNGVWINDDAAMNRINLYLLDTQFNLTTAASALPR